MSLKVSPTCPHCFFLATISLGLLFLALQLLKVFLDPGAHKINKLSLVISGLHQVSFAEFGYLNTCNTFWFHLSQ